MSDDFATDPRITFAQTLEQLLQAVTTLHEEHGEDANDMYDDMALPTFGGPPVDKSGGAFSWDPERVLVGDEITTAEIITREQYEEILADERPD
jgi:hypothetical protein